MPTAKDLLTEIGRRWRRNDGIKRGLRTHLHQRLTRKGKYSDVMEDGFADRDGEHARSDHDN